MYLRKSPRFHLNYFFNRTITKHWIYLAFLQHFTLTVSGNVPNSCLVTRIITFCCRDKQIDLVKLVNIKPRGPSQQPMKIETKLNYRKLREPMAELVPDHMINS